jgi:hypothetical protein
MGELCITHKGDKFWFQDPVGDYMGGIKMRWRILSKCILGKWNV